MKSAFARSIRASLLVFILGSLAVVGFIMVSAQLDSSRAEQHVTEAFANGTLASGPYRAIEIVPGFLVMESDNFSTCVMLSQMLAPSETVFAKGVWGATGGADCAALQEAVTGGPTVATTWYRYWHGASAVSKVLLTVMSVHSAQILLTVILLALLAAIIWRVAVVSRAMAAAAALVLLGVSDLAWHGLSLVHGISSSIGLAGVLVTLVAFQRGWAGKWGVVLVAGFAYAAAAQMLTPIAFAILASIMAMLPLLRGRGDRLGPWVGLIVGVVWVGGYVAGLLSRYLWVATLGPGLQQIQGELTGTGNIYAITSAIHAFHSLVGLIMKTWLNVGWMQVGLMVTFAVAGWILGTGGARGLRRIGAYIAATPVLLGVGWLIVWAGHTNHTFVNVLIALMLLCLVFALAYARYLGTTGRQAEPDRTPESGDSLDSGVVRG